MAQAKSEAPRFVAGALRDERAVLPGSGQAGQPGQQQQRRNLRGEVLPAKGPARAPWPALRLQVLHPSQP